MRFIHKNNIQPAGWIKISGGNYIVNQGTDKLTNCQIDITVENWKKVKSFESEEAVPFLTAVYDIECNSYHGDFPLVGKTTREVQNPKKFMNTHRSIAKRLLYQTFITCFFRHSYFEQPDSQQEYPVSHIFTKARAKPNKKFLDLKA